jgi:hypothetical protein
MKSLAPYAFDSNNPISSSIAQQLTTSEASWYNMYTY